MNKIIGVVIILLWLTGCSSETVKEKINQAGDVAGQAAGEFMEGAAKGVEKAFDVKVQQSDELKQKGVQFGKSTVSNDSTGTDNLLTVYVIFNKDFSGKLTAKAFDGQLLEMGRAALDVSAKQNETKFLEFHFDKRTNIDSKNLLTIE